MRDVLSKLPPNSSKKFPGKRLEKVAARAEQRGMRPLAPRTANSYMAKLSALFKWAEREEFVDRNPAISICIRMSSGSSTATFWKAARQRAPRAQRRT